MLVLTVGAAALAAWVDRRWPARIPQTAGPLFAHLLAGLLATSLAVPALMALLGTQHSPSRALAALLALFLPALVYCFLSWIWLLRFVKGLLRPV